MKLEADEISNVNGHHVIKVEDVYKVFELDEIGNGIRQVGHDFASFKEAAEFALSLPDFLNKEAE